MGLPEILPHERWFTSERPPADWAFALEPATLALVAGAIAAAVAWRSVGRRLPRPELPFLAPLGRLAPWVPRLLAIHAGVSLLAQAARGSYLAPALELPDNAFGIGLRILEGVLGVWLISGFRVRWAAAAVVVAGPLAIPRYGLVPVLERMDLLGIALFLALLPPGPDGWGEVRTRADRIEVPVFWLRALVGGALVVLAFSEKLANPDLALAFLDRFPAFNLLRTLGLEVADITFVRIAGAFELLFGLLLISGTLPQIVVIAAGIPFNATLFFLGAEELIGHLPIYGAMLALLVYGSSPELARAVDRFRWRRIAEVSLPTG
ncbi:MAG TPA: hypothetical protein VF029_03985 [Actinomycetota bacterium]